MPSEFKTLDNGVIQRQENEQPLSEFSLDGGFYIYLNGHKFDADMMTFNQIGKRRKQDMDMALHKRFPLMTEEQRTSTINEIEKLGENLNNGQGDAKAEKYAFHWVMNSGIVLPEDNDKIITGIKICEKHKINAFQKNAPTLGEILEKYTQVEEPDNVRVNPDVYLGKEFSEKKEYPFGITVYTIDEGREEEDTPLWWDQDNIDIDKAKKAQMAVRKIIDTHWGKDANPWCLASRKSGLDKAFELWKYYTAEAKRIAFVNGKLAGFYAGDVSNLCTWWNRRDEKTDGIPLVFKDNDGTVFEGRYNDEYYDDEEYNEESDDYRAVITKVIYPDKIEREFYLNGNLKSEKRPDGTIHRWYYNGAPMEEIMPDGTHYKWDERGNIIGFMLPNGVYREYSEYDRERIEFDELPDGTRLYYFDDNKTIKSKHRPNGTIITYYRSGGIEQLLLSDGTLFKWRENGTMESIERESDGFLKEFYDDGTPKHAEDNNGFIQDWNSEGRVVTIEDPDTGYSYSFETYSDGTPQHEEDSNGLLRDWNRQGILIYEDDPVTGRQFEAKEDGTPQYESSPDGEREWDDDGNLTYSTYPEDQDSIYREDEDEEYDEDDSYDDDENETFYQTNQAADLPFEDDEYLSPDAVKDVDGWLQWNDEYQNKIDLYKNERAAFKAIRELGGIRYQDLVDALGEALAKDLRSAFPTLFRKSGGQEQLPVDVLLQNLNEHTELQIPQFEYVDDFIDWLYKTSLERPKRPAPIVEINPDTEDALISRLGLDGAREYTKVRREYLNKLQKRIQAEYDRD
ncbi:MAG: hypothetical protein IJ141_10875, partial [Lachnospiraceae bacterium]|nr:hypothetical protein [Lachnospiraceae bacterium]